MIEELPLWNQADQKRAALQLARVQRVVLTGAWLTLSEIAGTTGDPESSVSARLRQMRKLGYTVECQRRRDGGGLREYRVTVTQQKAG